MMIVDFPGNCLIPFTLFKDKFIWKKIVSSCFIVAIVVVFLGMLTVKTREVLPPRMKIEN